MEMKFDTRDVKPNLYNVLFLTIAAAAVVCMIAVTGYGGVVAGSIVMDCYFFAVLCMLLAALQKQMQYNPYSYNTIYYIGFALFILFLLMIELMLTVRIIRTPEAYRVTDLVDWMEVSAKLYMILSFPFVLIFSILLCVSNISLIRHEGKRVVNLLGILFGILFTGGAVLLYCMDYYVSGSTQEILRHQLLTNFCTVIYLYLECMLIGAIAASIIVLRYEPEPDKDYLIILGCGLRKDGTPTPLLRGRIDRAIDFYRKQKEKTGKELRFVASGGKGKDEAVAEGVSIQRYLLSQGIPKRLILVEDQSSDTFENMKYSKGVIEGTSEITKETKIAFSTTNYHVFRSGLFARRVKMRAVGIGAKTKWYFWPNAWVREFIGLLTEHRGKQALTIGGMTAIFIVLTLMSYL